MPDYTLVLIYWVITYLVSVLGGGLFAGCWVNFLLKGIDPIFTDKKLRILCLEEPRSWWLVWSLGIFERTVATTLMIFCGFTLALGFVGGWLTLKTAAGWKETNYGQQTSLATIHLSSLVGSAISLSVAILAGLVAKYILLPACLN